MAFLVYTIYYLFELVYYSTTYLIFSARHIRYLHVVSWRANIFILLASEDVETNKMNLQVWSSQRDIKNENNKCIMTLTTLLIAASRNFTFNSAIFSAIKF